MNYQNFLSTVSAPVSVVESSRISDFPHCPNPSCANFSELPADGRWFAYHGTYATKVVGSVRRYRCRACGSTFSFRTFDIDYYTKKTVDYLQLMEHLVATTGEGNICRFHDYREDLLLNRYERLSRSLMSLQCLVRDELISCSNESAIVLDGFESFSHSQYHPNNINILIGKKYEFIYGIGLSVLSRKGRMTVSQKKTRNVLEKANKTDSRETLHCVRNLLQDFVGDFSTNGGAPRTLFTDEHKDYPKAIRIVDPDHRFFSHQTISSKKYRNYRNYLFVANYTDRQLRKDSANFVRETVQFARCPQAMLTRTTIYEVYHNCFSPWRIKQWRKKDQRSRAELMGIPTERLGLLVKQTWGKRGFRGKCHLWVEEAKTWEMKWRNPGIPMGRRVAKYILV